MFEIDENTKYSLRLLGRGSLILVSLALILAIIGYVLRDSATEKAEHNDKNVFVASRLEMSQEYRSGNLFGKQITINGKVDSLSKKDEVTELYFFQTASRNMICCRIKNIPQKYKVADSEIKIRGTLRESDGKIMLMDKCVIPE